YRKKFANNLKNELPKIPLVEDYATFEKISRAGRDLAELHLHFEPEPNVANLCSCGLENSQLNGSNGDKPFTLGSASLYSVHRLIPTSTLGLNYASTTASALANRQTPANSTGEVSAALPAQTTETEEALYEKYYVQKVRQSDDKTKLLFYNRQGDIFHTLDIPPEVEKWQINGSTCTWWIEKMYKVTTDPKTGRVNDPNDYAREYGNPKYIIELAENVIKIAVQTVKILDELNKIEVEI
ncbi:hypothetical protein IJJ97_04900, partial [bacterium]|nr:hypothetical protein [bacterium]